MKDTVTRAVESWETDGFEIGETASIDDMTEADARAIFGDELFETWQRYKSEARPPTAVTVTSVTASALTLDGDP
jgi:hypothetical protein